jgi:L-ascorbate metabolism protein UlaG (beta-lactamase superfamily)
VYDYYNRPTVRFFESLLYESDYFDTSLHSLRLFRQTHDTSRPFFMNTPRLPAKGQIRWEVPFESPLIDELFKLDSAPKPLGHLREMLDLKPADEEVLLPLLSADPYCARKKREGSGVFINYLGHACVLIEWNGISILTDPCIGLKPVKGGVERFTYKDLPEKLDYVLITHNHHDHFCLESLLRLRHKIDCLVVPRSFGILYGDLSLKLLAKKVGFKNVVELETLESIKLSDGEIIAIPFMGEHADLSHGKTAYVVRAGSTQTLFAADSDCLDVQMYQHIYRVLGPIQTVFLGMECVGAPLSWSCGAFLPCKPEHSINQSRRYKGCDSTRGLSILEAVGAQRIYIYAMGLEPWLEYLLGLAYTAEATQIKEAQKLLSAARERGFSDAQLLTNKAEIHLMNHA